MHTIDEMTETEALRRTAVSAWTTIDECHNREVAFRAEELIRAWERCDTGDCDLWTSGPDCPCSSGTERPAVIASLGRGRFSPRVLMYRIGGQWVVFFDDELDGDGQVDTTVWDTEESARKFFDAVARDVLEPAARQFWGADGSS